MAFGLFFLTASNCNSSLLHILQPQLLTGSSHHPCLQVSLSYSNVTFRQSGRTVLQCEGEVTARFLMRNCSLAMSSAKHRCGEGNGRNCFAFCF
jgi:hypothetical protein